MYNSDLGKIVLSRCCQNSQWQQHTLLWGLLMPHDLTWLQAETLAAKPRVALNNLLFKPPCHKLVPSKVKHHLNCLNHLVAWVLNRLVLSRSELMCWKPTATQLVLQRSLCLIEVVSSWKTLWLGLGMRWRLWPALDKLQNQFMLNNA